MKRLLPCVLLVALVGCGGDSSPSAPSNSQLNVSGTWTGTAVDQLGSGTARAQLSQSGNAISGTWSVQSSAGTNAGTVLGSSSGTNVSLTLTPSDPRTCGYSVTAAVTNGSRMAGSYASVSCTTAVAGTITLNKQ